MGSEDDINGIDDINNIVTHDSCRQAVADACCGTAAAMAEVAS